MPDCIGSNWKIFLVEKNKVYGTEEEFKRTATWLHVFDKDPDVKMKFFSQGISQTAQIGFTIRRAPDTAFVDIVYSFADNRWHIRSQESESAKPQIIQANVIATLKSGQWYSMRIIADGQHLLVYLDDHLIIQTQETKRTGCGRVGVFAQGACLFIDDVDILFRDGDIPQDGLLSYPIIPDVFSHFLELEGLEDQHQLIGVGRKKLISFNEGLTWNDITDDPEWNGLYYNHWYTSLLKLRSNSRYSQIAAKTAFQVSDDLKHWMTEGQIVPEEEQKDEYGRTLVVTHVNSTTEIQLENGSYRLFCPVGFRRYDQEGNIKGHYTKIYFSDDSGKTFRCSKTTTKELLPGYSDDGNTTWCESKVIRCSDNSLRMYYSRNYLGCMHYTVSLDEGETWKGLYAIPEMQNAMTSYAIIEDYSQSTTFYMLRLDGAAEFLGSIFPRNHLMLLKSTDGMNWNFLFHCEWMSDFCSPKNQFPLYQILDPSLFVTDKYVYITYGFSQHEYSPDEPPHHQSQRCYYIRAEKDKLFGKPIYTDHDRDFKTIATSMRQ